MAAQAETASPAGDVLKWGLVAILLVAGLAGFYYFSDQSLLLRIIGLLVLGGMAAYVAVQTEKGRNAWVFVLDARVEVRKVVWPSRKETVQTTMIVIGMVTLVAIILYFLDFLLGSMVRWVLGQGG